ncbi:cobyrinate a,c-diamide synthase [Granulicella tundricola]|uniref:Cobyrinate a,c-diamide synthase n=1 Tax=Granulicella tundricola (strain ATCC BAA-1859 / DSM 23138 / MP5ACTX9) TaxID=1198114 RepID=E8X1C7_GRATM|nr:cobyrinate a,c-diamide synthase [Granulicella tundricola]ADW69081.1 cobyrinic acid a,c-diamide synthase [Granulicella tundricola MP5ACTX9]
MSNPLQTAFLVAGNASGVGKTTVTQALIAALQRRGLVVQPFKGGPDYLDTTHHTRLAGRPARNLDTWLLPHEANRDLFTAATQDADAAVVEGMMGLFDGKDPLSETGSSAEIARILGLPIILVLDASKTARSIAATVLGFETFDPTLPIAGVILNRIGGPRHLALLTAAIESRCKTPVLGSLPRTPEITIPERHLGLHAAAQSTETLQAESTLLADLAEQHFNLEAIQSLHQQDFPLPASPSPLVPGPYIPRPSALGPRPCFIGIPRDEAFSFYYEDNLDLLRSAGATLIPFSPLADAELPENLDALYLGGGYPELHAQALSENHSLLTDIRNFAATNRPIYAECGGMIYLSESITQPNTPAIPLTGILPLNIEMTPKLVDFGYVTTTFTRDCLLGPTGTVIRGHSFHYSRLTNEPELNTAYHLDYSLSKRQAPEGYTRGNILASYVHLHFRANPAVVTNLIASIVAARPADSLTLHLEETPQPVAQLSPA